MIRVKRLPRVGLFVFSIFGTLLFGMDAAHATDEVQLCLRVEHMTPNPYCVTYTIEPSQSCVVATCVQTPTEVCLSEHPDCTARFVCWYEGSEPAVVGKYLTCDESYDRSRDPGEIIFCVWWRGLPVPGSQVCVGTDCTNIRTVPRTPSDWLCR